MTPKQYKSVIDNTLTQLPQEADSLTTVREILRNCGTPLPQGTPDQILNTLLSDDYMGWNECTYRDAVGYANAGVVAIGVGSDNIMLIEPQTDKPAASVAVAASASAAIRTNMIYYAYSSSATNSRKSTSHRPSTLDKLIKKFPKGKYWNHVGKLGNDPDGYTETKCSKHRYENGDPCLEDCNCFDGAYQCLGFAYKCGYDATGTYPSKWTRYDNREKFSEIKPGDIFTYNTATGTHTIYVTHIVGYKVIYGDCNGAGSDYCKIQWTKLKDLDECYEKFKYLRVAPKRLDT